MQSLLSRSSRRALHVSLPACTASQPVRHRGKPPAPPSLAHTRVLAPATAAADIQASRTLVFGDAVGNGRRSGRKWLRRPLRGPGIGSYYGVNFRDLLPSLITPEKEDLFRAEQALNRVGKTRITGKQKPFTKPLVDTMLFEEELDEVMENIDFDEPDAHLVPEEIEERERLLSDAKSESEREMIASLYERIAARREQTSSADRAVAAASAAASTAADGTAKKQKRKSSFVFRAGLEDKRSWGRPAAPIAAAAAANKADSDETEGSGTAGAVDADAKMDDVLAGLAAAAEFDADPDALSPPELEAAFAKYATARAAAEWRLLNEVKDEGIVSALRADVASLLEDSKLPVSAEGLAQLHLSDQRGKAEIIERARRFSLRK